jgi:hypothetical protein
MRFANVGDVVRGRAELRDRPSITGGGEISAEVVGKDLVACRADYGEEGSKRPPPLISEESRLANLLLAVRDRDDDVARAKNLIVSWKVLGYVNESAVQTKLSLDVPGTQKRDEATPWGIGDLVLFVRHSADDLG